MYNLRLEARAFISYSKVCVDNYSFCFGDSMLYYYFDQLSVGMAWETVSTHVNQLSTLVWLTVSSSTGEWISASISKRTGNCPIVLDKKFSIQSQTGFTTKHELVFFQRITTSNKNRVVHYNNCWISSLFMFSLCFLLCYSFFEKMFYHTWYTPYDLLLSCSFR